MAIKPSSSSVYNQTERVFADVQPVNQGIALQVHEQIAVIVVAANDDEQRQCKLPGGHQYALWLSGSGGWSKIVCRMNRSCTGHLYRLCGRAERLSQSHRSSLPQDSRSALHRTSGVLQLERCQLKTTKKRWLLIFA